ncbi:hypothetical protein OsJ_05361 [Oryza sativa Japonica Group]|uniref:Uncharacterized protein n=1 Tax=Oryza sativa subsp. japonica TaxID=39947 RepID=B9F2P8_ORYSJ|nr:hypothetical protein OsJ_05361 [Oryza sativa Japonica Group]
MARVVVFVVGGSCAASSVRILHYGAPSPSSERCSRYVRRDRSHRSFKPPFEVCREPVDRKDGVSVDTAAYLHALDPTVQYRDKHSLETCYEPLFFFRKHPAVEFHHPIDAPDSMFDRVILTEWAKPAMRGVLETISSHHSANLELTEFSLKDLKIFCNYQTPEFKPRFKLVCGTRNATCEGMRMNYIQAGQIFKEIVNASLGTPSSWDILIEDFQDLLQIKHPAVEFHHPIDAPDSMFDRVILTEWAKPAMRGVLETISSHHSANLELTEFSLKDLKIFCNYQTPEFKPRFKLVCGTRNATCEGMRMNYIQAGQIFKEIVNASLGTPSSWDILIEDFQDLLQMLENPILEEAYLMRNHPALLALKLHSQFFMACYETLMRASLQSVFEVFKMLPYGMNDSSGHWKVRLEQHPYLWWMLHSQFTSYGDRNSEQCRYRRNYSCHKIHHLTKRTERFKWYSANDVDMLLYQYLPMSLPGLMRAMWDEGLLAPFCLRLDELFTK